MVIVQRLRGNIIGTALCWIVWHNVHSQQHTYMSSSYRSNRLGLSDWDPCTVHRGGCLELYYCNMVEWFWWDLSLILTTIWFPSALWHYWFGDLACKSRAWNDLYYCVEWDVKLLHYTVHNRLKLHILLDTIEPSLSQRSCQSCYLQQGGNVFTGVCPLVCGQDYAKRF